MDLSVIFFPGSYALDNFPEQSTYTSFFLTIVSIPKSGIAEP